jgi:hypothetical protein
MVARYYLTKIFADDRATGYELCSPKRPSLYFSSLLVPNDSEVCRIWEPPEVCSTLYWAIRWIQEQRNFSLAEHAATDTATAWLYEPILHYDSPLHHLFKTLLHVRFTPSYSSFFRDGPLDSKHSCKDLPHHLRAFGLDWPRRACQAIPLSMLSERSCLWAVPCVHTPEGIDYYFEPHGITLFSWLAVGKRVGWRYVVTTPDGLPRWGTTPTDALLSNEPPPPYHCILHSPTADFSRLWPTRVEVQFDGLATRMQAPLWIPEEHLLDGHAMDLHSRYCWGTVLMHHSAEFYHWVRRVLHDEQRLWLFEAIPGT